MDTPAEDSGCLLREHSKDSEKVLGAVGEEEVADMGRRSGQLPLVGGILYRSLLLSEQNSLSDGLSILFGHPVVGFYHHLKHPRDCAQLEYCQGHCSRDWIDRSRSWNFHLRGGFPNQVLS
jgi:hypothetical protein